MVPPVDSSPSSEPLNLLLVGRELDDLARIREVLAETGIASRLEITTDSQRALEWLCTTRHGVCLLNSRLQGMRGIDLLQAAREAGCHLPIIMLTCSSDVEDEQAARQAGAFDCLNKNTLLPALLGCSLRHAVNEADRIRQLKQQQQTVRQLYQQLELVRGVLDQHAIVSEADRAGNIIAVNDLFCTISGYSREELLGQNHRLLKSGEHPAELYQQLWSTISRGQSWHGEICNRRKDGELYWVQATIVPIADEHGRPQRYISIRTDITAQKRDELALRLLGHAVRASASGIAIMDASQANPRIRYVNPALNRMTGYSPDELVAGGSALLFGPQTDMQSRAEALQQLRAGQSVRQLLLCLYRKNGTPFWCDFSASWALDEQGDKTSLYVVVLNDVTEQKMAEDALRESEERLRRSQNYANIGTWDLNIQTGELLWSEQIAPMFGYQGVVETSYENFISAVHPEDRQSVIDAISGCIERGEKYRIQHRVQWPDGTLRWLLEQGDVTRLADGTPTHMLGVVQDVTVHKEVSEQLRINQARLTNAQRIAHLGNWDLDLASNRLHCSEQIYAILDIDPAVQIDLDRFYASVHPDDLAQIKTFRTQVLHDGKTEQSYRILRPDGEVRHLRAITEASFAADGRPLTLSGTTQDITEQVLRETALRQAKQEAEQANQAKSEFLSSMSHELRTPMNAILGFAQLLQLRRELTTEQQQDVAEILKAGRHLLELINEVLDLSRIEAGALSLSLEPVLCCEAIDESLALLQPMAEHHGILLREDPRKVCFVWFQADRTRLKQVLVNLISNAIKYNRPHGSVTLRMVSGSPGFARIEVSDTGYGIDEALLPLLFQPFQRLDAATRGIEGTGIGLAICKRLVESMGGTLGVESSPDIGSTFWLELPRIEPATPAAAHLTEMASPALPASMAAATLLYVEDNPANLRLVEQIVATRPHWRLLSASTPEIGLELIEVHANTLDVILLDIDLPGMNGYQMLKRLQDEPRTAAIPVLALSANAMPNDIRRGLAAGFLDYLVKPIEVPEFLRILDGLLEQRPTQPKT